MRFLSLFVSQSRFSILSLSYNIKKLTAKSAPWLLMLGFTTSHADTLYLPNQVNYGQIVAHHSYEIDPSYTRGALLGAITGAVIAENSRGWGALGGALVGAGLEGAITSGNEAHKVVVRLVDGQSFSVATPPNSLRQGDCVAVEQTENGTELLKVSYQFCEDAKEQAQRAATQSAHQKTYQKPSKETLCAEARSRLRYASESDYNRVLADVQRFCQD